MLEESKKLQTEWQHSKNQLYVMCNAAQTLGLSGLAESISSVVTNMDSVISDMKKSVDKSINDRFSDAQTHSANLLKLALNNCGNNKAKECIQPFDEDDSWLDLNEP